MLQVQVVCFLTECTMHAQLHKSLSICKIDCLIALMLSYLFLLGPLLILLYVHRA